MGIKINFKLSALLSGLIGVFLFSTIALSQTVIAWGDSFTSGEGGISWPQQFESLSGITTLNRGVGGDTSTQIATRFLADPSAFNDFTVIWAGRNNYTDPSTVESDIALIVSSLITSDYLILGIINGNYGGYESVGGTGYSLITGINSNLATTYGSRFIDIREALVYSYDPLSSLDVSDFARDIVPSSLRNDNVHLNTAGYGIVANFVYQAYLAVPP
jgi:lysophospholipase L1-like esterase